MSSQARQLLQLLRLASNRTCADCDAPLSDSTNVWASTTHGVFICVNCVSVHRKIGVHISRVRSVNHDVWTEEELVNMKHSGGNAFFNSTYEKYLPRGVLKPLPDASFEEREAWIRAKYEYKGFLLPLFREDERRQNASGNKRRSNREARALAAAAKTHLPIRLVDYFVAIGMDVENTVLLAPRASDFVHLTPVPTPVTSPTAANFDFASPPPTPPPPSPAVGPPHHAITPDMVKLTCAVADHYPDPSIYAEEGPDGCPLPEHVAQFVFPDGYSPAREELAPTFFTFVLTNVNGIRSYGAALRVYEDVDSMPNAHAIRAALAQAFMDAELEVPSWVSKPADGPTPSPSPSLFGSSSSSTVGSQSLGLAHTLSASASTVSLSNAGSHSPLPPPQPSLFLPKALVFLSHYPFFAVFREVLLELYRISISSAPLPIERYLANFVCEVPLPPQGQVEVKFALPDRTLTISRPPRNRLPMVAFSLRPLFTLLNVDNILLVFGLLLTETKVALCSAHYALLTPVTEAFLALLFPFVWQGALIPVMPLAMTDILEAPVPFFLGLHRRYLDHTPASHRPAGVVFVDLDNDEVYLGYDDDKMEPRVRPRLPDRETHKLRQKLLEHGGVAYHPRAVEVENADLAFPNNEHHLPISSFGTEQGMTQKAGTQGGGGSSLLSQLNPASVMSTFGFRQGTGGKGGGRGDGFRHTHASSRTSANNNTFKHVAGATLHVSILNENNNEGMPDRFSASEVRAAFLRFFVSVFRNYQQYVYSPQPGGDPTPPPGGEAFNKEAFVKESAHLSDSSSETLHLMLSSQMFERFIEERIANANHPQIKFFDESINAKLNRAKTQLVKKETPFLDDSTDQITETFNPPPPSNWGLPDTGEGYTYLAFPQLRPDLFGNIRKPRRLFKFPEQQRTGSKSVNAQVYQRSLSNLEKTTPSTSPQPTPKKGRLDVLRDLATKKVDRTLRGIVCAQKTLRMRRCRLRYQCLRRAIVRVQRRARARAACRADVAKYHARRLHILTIQSLVRRQLAYRVLRTRRASAGRLQRWARMALVRRRFLAKRRALVTLQSFVRGRRARASFLFIRDLVVNAQAVMRGWLQRRLAASERRQRLSELRRHIFHLWKLAHTPLVYRSRFWMMVDGTGFLHLAIHEDETLKLWKDLGFKRSKGASFVSIFREVEAVLRDCEEARRGHDPATPLATPLSSSTGGPYDGPSTGGGGGGGGLSKRLSLRAAVTPGGGGESGGGRSSLRLLPSSARSGGGRHNSARLGNHHVGPPDLHMSLLFAHVADPKHLSVAAERLEGERHSLYSAMKAQQAAGQANDSFFHLFGLGSQKRRKRHLCQLVWQDLDKADASTHVVLGTIGTDLSKDWVQTKLDQRIRSDLLSTVQACLISIRHTKKSYRRMKTRVMTQQELHDNVWKASHLVIKGGHRRKPSSLGSISPICMSQPSPSPITNAMAAALLNETPVPSGRHSANPSFDLATIKETGRQGKKGGGGGIKEETGRRSVVLSSLFGLSHK